MANRHMPILGLGHPRTGTGFTSKILNMWGLDVGHEVIGRDGIVSWLLFTDGPNYLWQNEFSQRPDYDHLIYNVRNPKTALCSIVYTETPHITRSGFKTSGDSFKVDSEPVERVDFISHRHRRCYFNMHEKNPIENAIVSMVGMHGKISELKPDVTYRIEDQSRLVFEYLKPHYPNIEFVQHKTAENTRKHPDFTEMLYDFGPPRDEFVTMINAMCVELGYKEIDFKEVVFERP